MNEIQNGMRVEVRLHLGEADVWYAGTVVDAARRRVHLDSGTHLASDTHVDIEAPDDWRPMRTSPDVGEV